MSEEGKDTSGLKESEILYKSTLRSWLGEHQVSPENWCMREFSVEILTCSMLQMLLFTKYRNLPTLLRWVSENLVFSPIAKWKRLKCVFLYMWLERHRAMCYTARCTHHFIYIYIYKISWYEYEINVKSTATDFNEYPHWLKVKIHSCLLG